MTVRSCYDEGKRAAETLCFDYHRQNGVDIRVARIFNTYGPGMHPYDGRVVSNFLVQAINGEDITVYGEGEQTRAFCFVDDLVDGLIRLMNQDVTIGPINIGNPGAHAFATSIPPPPFPAVLCCAMKSIHIVVGAKARRLSDLPRALVLAGEFTIKQLAELAIKTVGVSKVTGKQSKIIYLPLPGDDPKQRKPDITKAKKYLGWEPKIPLEQGIVKAAEYFSSLDLSRFKKPTKHTAHLNTEQIEESAKKKQRV
jgi:UDP-glucuronate decarboxylase